VIVEGEPDVAELRDLNGSRALDVVQTRALVGDQDRWATAHRVGNSESADELLAIGLVSNLTNMHELTL
jgi:hypothetical protein